MQGYLAWTRNATVDLSTILGPNYLVLHREWGWSEEKKAIGKVQRGRGGRLGGL
jgi:hypothetical protein